MLVSVLCSMGSEARRSQRASRQIAPLAVVLIIVVASCSATENDVTAPSSTTPLELDRDVNVHGHRGARGLKPESTLPSFEIALDIGVDTLEFDLHFTADGEVVIWHDPVISADKCGLKPGAPSSVPDPADEGAPPGALAIRALTVSELRWFDCSRNPDPDRFPEQDPSATELAGDDFGIITLGELITFVEMYAQSDGKSPDQRSVANVVAFNIETKRDPRDPGAIGDGFDGASIGPFELRLLEVIDEYELAGRVVIQSFDERSLRAIHAEDPTMALALLTATPIGQFGAVAAAGASTWSPRSDTATQTAIDAAHEAGLSVIPWTVNVESEMRELAHRGIDGIITDRPDIAVGLFSQG